MAKKEKPEDINGLSPHSQIKVSVVKQLISEGAYDNLEQWDETIEPLLEDIKRSQLRE